jgi:hypothetical protein
VFVFFPRVCFKILGVFHCKLEYSISRVYSTSPEVQTDAKPRVVKNQRTPNKAGSGSLNMERAPERSPTTQASLPSPADAGEARNRPGLLAHGGGWAHFSWLTWLARRRRPRAGRSEQIGGGHFAVNRTFLGSIPPANAIRQLTHDLIQAFRRLP